jgi:hypothetical protein
LVVVKARLAIAAGWFAWVMVLAAVGARDLAPALGHPVVSPAPPSLPQLSEPDPRVKPGNRFTLKFPQLDKTHHGTDAKCEVYIPKDYDSGRQVPLLVWFSGGAGSHGAGVPRAITGGSGFVCVGLPYRESMDSDREGNGGWKTHWPYYKVMLDAVEKAVPNIHPAKRSCGGFSSGGFAILWSIAHSGGAFEKYFYGFVPGGAGKNFGGLKAVRGRPMLLYMGDRDKRYKDYVYLNRAAQTAGVDVEFMVLKNIDHELPASAHPRILEWIKEKIVYRDLPAAVAKMQRAQLAKNWPDALRYARQITGSAEQSMPQYTQARDVIAQACEAAEVELDRLLRGRPSTQILRKFIDNWQPCPSVAKAVEVCNAQGKEALAVLLKLKGPVRVARL